MGQLEELKEPALELECFLTRNTVSADLLFLLPTMLLLVNFLHSTSSSSSGTRTMGQEVALQAKALAVKPDLELMGWK